VVLTISERLTTLEAQVATNTAALQVVIGLMESMTLREFGDAEDVTVDIPLPDAGVEREYPGTQKVVRDHNAKRAWARARLAKLKAAKDSLPPPPAPAAAK
jgi:hypothetical protein